MIDIYDAIVVGTGISGGWAAKELCEKGLKTLVLELGPMIQHPIDYTTANMTNGISKEETRSPKKSENVNPSKAEPIM